MNSVSVRTAPVWAVILATAACLTARPTYGAEDSASPTRNLYRRDNLMAWCIVPFDAKKRGPEERAAMLEKLGFKHFAYDYRAEHVPTFDAEIEACKRHGVSLDAWWFPGSLSAEAKQILAICKKHDIRPELWVSGGGAATANETEQRARVKQEADRIRPIAEAAAAQGMKVGLYNHGGWYGEPENQLEIIAELGLPNVGIVYNFHHGHDHLERFAALLPKMKPHLLAINLNGMVPQGDRQGRKILQLGQGTLELELLRTIRASGYQGPIGILGHTQDDAEARLADNLDGLDWLLPQLDGKPAGPKPVPRTPVPGRKEAGAASAPAAKSGGWTIAGREEYRTAPLTVTVRGTLTGSAGYNILVACDTKASGAHWEVFTMPKSGLLTAYLPGSDPDHVRSPVNIVDGKPHSVTMTYASDRVRLYVDGRPAAEQAIRSRGKPTVAGELAVGRLVEGTFLCDGKIESLHLKRGAGKPDAATFAATAASADTDTLGLWKFDDASLPEVADASPLKNSAKRAAASSTSPGKQPEPSAGVHLTPVDPKLKAVLIDRTPDEVYMGVKADRDGNLFVGGREGLFVFEARADGTFAPRRELLRFPKESIIMGIEFRNDDLFVLTANALYYVAGGRVRREGLTPERMLWGLPLDLHVSFHCLALGGNWELYISHGDPLLGYGDWSRPDHWGHWTLYSRGIHDVNPDALTEKERAGCLNETTPPAQAEIAGGRWRRTPFTGQGAILRLNVLDGRVEVVATGLRGPVGLAFNSDGNLFTNDNDHESRADQYAPAKLLHVTEGLDFGWPRGWMASKSPDRFDLIEPVCDLGRGVPCDMAYYDHDFLPDSFRERLLLCRWDRHAVTSFALKGDNITFTAQEETVLTGNDDFRPVGITFDRRGRLFVTGLYMTGNMAAPYCASDLVMITPRSDGTGSVRPLDPREDKISGFRRAVITGLGPVYAGKRIKGTQSKHLLVRQIATRHQREELEPLEVDAADEWYDMAEVLIHGHQLTVPPTDYVPPLELSLFYPKESSFFKRNQSFHGSDEPVDLATFGRIGSFTAAEWWSSVPHSKVDEGHFTALVRALDHSPDEVRLQAAYFLSLLKDPRSEPLVQRVRREVQLRRLSAARELRIGKAWEIGPFPYESKGDAGGAEIERRPLDLSAAYDGFAWRETNLAERSRAGTAQGITYYSFRVVSGSRQPALFSVKGDGNTRLWQNEMALEAAVEGSSEHGWIVDLQPGSNEFLWRADGQWDAARLQAVGQIELTRAEKLDSAMLAERLRSAAGGAATAVPAEFAAVDWGRAALNGDPAEGRRLFGTLACSKCHAVVPDQKAAGAPSLFEAKRRFTVPHLVESVLLPSRLVAEPFRAQSIVTEDGRTITGLVTSESEVEIELLQLDAARVRILKRQIEERSPTTISPMPQGLVKTTDELRHLLAYLLSDRPLPP
jgi:putative heme-binding domain-containing protein